MVEAPTPPTPVWGKGEVEVDVVLTVAVEMEASVPPEFTELEAVVAAVATAAAWIAAERIA